MLFIEYGKMCHSFYKNNKQQKLLSKDHVTLKTGVMMLNDDNDD